MRQRDKECLFDFRYLSMNPLPTEHIMLRTSISHPLRIDSMPVYAGKLGLTLCPGKIQDDAVTGQWHRDLGIDLAAIKEWGADMVISLVEQAEFEELRIPDFPNHIKETVPVWLHLPIIDRTAPPHEWTDKWRFLRLVVADVLQRGGNVMVHCKGGIGRAGTIAAMILIDSGITDPEEAIRIVRQTRSKTAIETAGQEAFVRAYRPGPPLDRTSVRSCLSLWTGAAGDALGYPVEFYDVETIQRDFGPCGVRFTDSRLPLRVSDDTQMSIFTVSGLSNSDGTLQSATDYVKQAYLAWLEGQQAAQYGERPNHSNPVLALPGMTACRAPGRTCINSLRKLRNDIVEENDRKGTGALMRTAAIAWQLHDADPTKRIALTKAITRLTHHHPWAVQTSMLMTELCVRLLNRDEEVTDAISAVMEVIDVDDDLESLLLDTIDQAAFWSPNNIQHILPGGEGWLAEECFASALAVIVATKDFPASWTLEVAANHSGDSDSVASVTGHIIGLIKPMDTALINALLNIEEFDTLCFASELIVNKC